MLRGELTDTLHELAKSDNYQTLLCACKELNGIKLFDNCNNFSSIQLSFINLLFLYYNILQDIEIDNISKLTLEDRIYAEAYVNWKHKKGKEYRQQQTNNKGKGKLRGKKEVLFERK